MQLLMDCRTSFPAGFVKDYPLEPTAYRNRNWGTLLGGSCNAFAMRTRELL